MADDSNRTQLQNKANELRNTIAQFDAVDTNHDHKLSGKEVAEAVVRQWAADHANEADPFKPITDRLKIAREGKAAAKFSGGGLNEAYAKQATAKGELDDMLQKVVGRLQQTLRFNAAEVGVTDEQQRAEADAKASRIRQDVAAAVERGAIFGELLEQIEQLPPGAAKDKQMQELRRQLETGEVSPEMRKQQMELLAPIIAKTDEAMRANLQAQAPLMAAGAINAAEQVIAQMEATAVKAMANMPPEIQQQQLAGRQAAYAQMRAAAQQQAAQAPHMTDRTVGAAQQARAAAERDYLQGDKAKPADLHADVKREVQALQHKLAEYKPENIATPTFDELSAAIAKQNGASKPRER